MFWHVLFYQAADKFPSLIEFYVGEVVRVSLELRYHLFPLLWGCFFSRSFLIFDTGLHLSYQHRDLKAALMYEVGVADIEVFFLKSWFFG